ncbi:MAG: hypothetical protein IKC34_00850 [Clostridia bacterium]|nr:hypothetical protein [Clostridia bacterium]
MFKLKRIVNSGANVPEPELLSSQLSVFLKAGSTAYCKDGLISPGGESTIPTHVLLRNKDKGETEALCYKIYPNMIFEVEVVGDNVAALSKGKKIRLCNEGFGYSKCSDEVEGGVALIVDMNGAVKSGDTVYVSFI